MPRILFTLFLVFNIILASQLPELILYFCLKARFSYFVSRLLLLSCIKTQSHYKCHYECVLSLLQKTNKKKMFLNFELSFDIVSGSVYPGLPFSFENRLFSNFDTSV